MDHWVSFLCHLYCGARIRITFKGFRSGTGFVSFSIYFYHVNGRANGGAGELIVFLLSLGFYGAPWRTDPGAWTGRQVAAVVRLRKEAEGCEE